MILFRALMVLPMLALPAMAESGASKARNDCLDEAARKGVAVRRVTEAQPTTDYQDRVIGYRMQLEVVLRGRTQWATCLVGAPFYRAVIDLPDRSDRDEGGRYDILSLRETERRCTRRAEDSRYRLKRVVGQEDVRSRGRVIGRETILNVRRDDRDWRLICRFDFRYDSMDASVYRR